MLPILYTDTDAIRAVLGITEEDLEDAQLIARNLDKELNIDLLSWLPTVEDLVSIGTDLQVDSIKLYSNYYCAALVAQSLRLAATQQTSDGQNSLDRYSVIDWKEIIQEMRERASFYRSYLITSLAETVISTFKPFASVGLATDPVTG